MGISVNSARLQQLVDRYETNIAAAAAWDISPSYLGRLLAGQRGKRPRKVLKRIAEVEKIPNESLWVQIGPDQTVSGSRVELVSGQVGQAGRFVYDVDNPLGMLLQVQNWFADLPLETRMRRHVVRAVMRTLADESFRGPQQPSNDWRIVMYKAEGWPVAEREKSTRRR